MTTALGRFCHRHVRGETDPQRIKDFLDRIKELEEIEQDRIKNGRR